MGVCQSAFLVQWVSHTEITSCYCTCYHVVLYILQELTVRGLLVFAAFVHLVILVSIALKLLFNVPMDFGVQEL